MRKRPDTEVFHDAAAGAGAGAVTTMERSARVADRRNQRAIARDVGKKSMKAPHEKGCAEARGKGAAADIGAATAADANAAVLTRKADVDGCRSLRDDIAEESAAPLWKGTSGSLGNGGWPGLSHACLLYTSPSPRDLSTSRMPSSA